MRKIIHVDMDAFYASVEQRDRPELRGRPVVVGGSPDSRGVVAAASYEARAFGIRSAMPAAQAYRLCPRAVFLKPDFPRYRAVSKQVRAVFDRVTDLVEPLSLDEAYLDVTTNHLQEPSATRVAEWIRREVRQATGLTASAGVAPNKFLAKIASDLDKPDGLVVVPPERVAAVLADLPVRKVPGIGKVAEGRCRARGIRVCGDFLRHDAETLTRWFGRSGPHYHALARGIDERPVEPDQERRSCSVEDTLAEDLYTRPEAQAVLERLAGVLGERLQAIGAGRTVTLKVKYADFTQVTRSHTLTEPTADPPLLLDVAARLLTRTEVGRRPVRLLGLGVSHFEAEQRQLQLPFAGWGDQTGQA